MLGQPWPQQWRASDCGIPHACCVLQVHVDVDTGCPYSGCPHGYSRHGRSYGGPQIAANASLATAQNVSDLQQQDDLGDWCRRRASTCLPALRVYTHRMNLSETTGISSSRTVLLNGTSWPDGCCNHCSRRSGRSRRSRRSRRSHLANHKNVTGAPCQHVKHCVVV
jgi:hypothetical protein